jgi:hypothetical protein
MGANPIESEVQASATSQKYSQASKLMLYTEALPKDIDFERLEEVRNELNERFKIYITTIIAEASTNIKDKTPL